MREERVESNGIPARIYDPSDTSGLLLFGHGGAHSKDNERFVRLSRTYAEHTGLAVVCIDAVDHGERKPEAVSAGLPRQWHSAAAEQMVADWQKTAEDLSSIGPAVPYVGFSMGMIFGAPTVASMASIKAAVLGVGGIPTGAGIDDPPLRATLLDAARSSAGAHARHDPGRGSSSLRTLTCSSMRFRVEGSGSCSGRAATTTGRPRRSATRSPSSTSTPDDALDAPELMR